MMVLATSRMLTCRARNIRSQVLFTAVTISRDARIDVAGIVDFIVVIGGNWVWEIGGLCCDRFPIIVLNLNVILNII